MTDRGTTSTGQSFGTAAGTVTQYNPQELLTYFQQVQQQVQGTKLNVTVRDGLANIISGLQAIAPSWAQIQTQLGQMATSGSH